MKKLSQHELEKIAMDLYYGYTTMEKLAKQCGCPIEEIKRNLNELVQMNPGMKQYLQPISYNHTPEKLEEIKRIASYFAKNKEGDER